MKPTFDEQIAGLERAIADLKAARENYTDPVAIGELGTYIEQLEGAQKSVESYQELRKMLKLMVNEGME